MISLLKQHRLLFATGTLGICALLAAHVTAMHSNPYSPVQTTPQPRPSGSVFGPGQWNGAQITEAATQESSSAQPGVEDDILLAENGDIVANQAMLNILNFFLIRNAPGNELASLRNYFAARLSPAALAQAMQIAESYQHYMREHDVLLSAQHLDEAIGEKGVMDLGRLRVWITQRALLRSRLLGAETARNWYANDDARVEDAIDQMQHPGGATAGNNVDPLYAPTREMVQHDELVQRRYLQEVLRGSVTKFASEPVRH